MKGWTPEGREIELLPRQLPVLAALLSRAPASLPARGRGFGYSTVLETALRYDRAGMRDAVAAKLAGLDMAVAEPRANLGGMRQQIAVIAGTYKKFREWCRENNHDPRTGPAFYATADALRGRSDVEVIRTGAWQDRDDLAEIETMLGYVNRVP